MIQLSESDKHFLMSLVYATGIILFWRGIWGIADVVPILSNVYVSFFIGLLILSLTGVIYSQFDPFTQKISKTTKLLHSIIEEAKKGEKYVIHYFDRLTGSHNVIHPHKVKRIEENHLVLEEKGKEVFIPIHRITHIKKDNVVIWKK